MALGVSLSERQAICSGDQRERMRVCTTPNKMDSVCSLRWGREAMRRCWQARCALWLSYVLPWALRPNSRLMVLAEQPSNFGNVPLGVVLLHEAGDGHAVFRLEVVIRLRRFGHLLTLTDQVLHFRFESARSIATNGQAFGVAPARAYTIA